MQRSDGTRRELEVFMVAALVSFGIAFLLSGIYEGICALRERRKDAKEHAALRAVYGRRKYR